MANAEARIVRIEGTRPHPTADRVIMAFVEGRQCVVATQYGFTKGSRAVFIPAGYILPEALAESLHVIGGSRRVHRMKIHGQESMGILAPLSILPRGERPAGKDVATVLGLEGEPIPANTSAARAKRRAAAKLSKVPLSSTSNLETLRAFPADVVFRALDAAVDAGLEKMPFAIPGTDEVYRVNVNSDRYRLFRRSMTCVCCGITGTEMVLQRYRNHAERVAHFNLYATNADGERILMTKDHIIPSSAGGPDHDDNYQTMCYPCNIAKGATMPTPGGEIDERSETAEDVYIGAR